MIKPKTSFKVVIDKSTLDYCRRTSGTLRVENIRIYLERQLPLINKNSLSSFENPTQEEQRIIYYVCCLYQNRGDDSTTS